MAKGYGAPKAPAMKSLPKFKSHFKTGFVSKWGKTPKPPGPPKRSGGAKIAIPKFNKVGKI